ncbi:hypothetical protein [Arachnia propionica]|nr:hypothetical protein [Arachnia propionica]
MNRIASHWSFSRHPAKKSVPITTTSRIPWSLRHGSIDGSLTR